MLSEIELLTVQTLNIRPKVEIFYVVSCKSLFSLFKLRCNVGVHIQYLLIHADLGRSDQLKIVISELNWQDIQFVTCISLVPYTGTYFYL